MSGARGARDLMRSKGKQRVGLRNAVHSPALTSNSNHLAVRGIHQRSGVHQSSTIQSCPLLSTVARGCEPFALCLKLSPFFFTTKLRLSRPDHQRVAERHIPHSCINHLKRRFVDSASSTVGSTVFYVAERGSTVQVSP